MRRLVSIDTGSGGSAEVNLSPLIDMVFLLLIFFMVTTVFVQETGVEVQKPKAATATDLEKSSILITQEGRVVYGGEQIGIARVRGMVARQLRERDMPVVVIADETSHTGVVVQVIDQCKLGGAKQVSIAAKRP
jgi:biopolymer transport protein ExbD